MSRIFERCVHATIVAVAVGFSSPHGFAAEAKSATPIYIKLEVEDFGGFGDYKSSEARWQPRMAWWPQWSRGGDSGWWAAQGPAAAASGDVSLDFAVPQTDQYALWVRYEDYIGKAEPFDVLIDYPGGQSKSLFGRQDVGPAQPPFPYNYVWVKQPVSLKKGPAKIHVVLAGASEVRRAVDAIVLTTDTAWTPRERGFPPLAYSQYLLEWGKARKPLEALVPPAAAPLHAWELPKISGRDFWYTGTNRFVPGFPRPVHILPEPNALAFAATYGPHAKSAPIYSSPVCAVQIPIAHVKKLLEPANDMRKYILDKKIPFVLIGNYNSAGQIPNSYTAMKETFGDLWMGIISGEGSYIGLPLYDKTITVGPNFKEQEYQWLLTQGGAAWRERIEKDWASPVPNPFEKLIFCASVGTLHNVHRLAEAGGMVLGTETAAAMPYAQQQAAFMRGAARQYGRTWAWYYGASFGDAIRTFTAESPYVLEIAEEKALVEKKQAKPLKIDNRNSIIGPSLAHIRRVLLNSYLQGASFFHPEQGYNLIGEDGKLNPMGWPYDEMIRLATRHPDRGSIYTPVAVLLDHAHGWEKYDYMGMRIWEREPCARADRMIDGFFNVAYFPFPQNEGEPATDLNVCWPNGYFGDIFDVLVTSPTKTDAIQNYPVVFCVGDTRLDPKWSAALKKYVADGGTLVINADQVVPGLDESFLGAKLASTSKEASTIKCLPDGEKIASTLFPYREAKPTTGEVIATTDSGDPVAIVNKVGKGRVILTTPSYLLGTDMAPTPYLARLLLQVTEGLLPVDVRGNCEHYVNLHPQGYVVTVSNNEGIAKLSHSAAVMNRSQTSTVKLHVKEKPLKTEDWLGEEPQSWSYPNEWLPEYTKPMTVAWQKDASGYGATITLQPGEIRVFFVQTK